MTDQPNDPQLADDPGPIPDSTYFFVGGEQLERFQATLAAAAREASRIADAYNPRNALTALIRDDIDAARGFLEAVSTNRLVETAKAAHWLSALADNVRLNRGDAARAAEENARRAATGQHDEETPA